MNRLYRKWQSLKKCSKNKMKGKQTCINLGLKINSMKTIKRVRLSEISELITKGTTPTTLGFEFQDEGINFLKIECFDEIGNYIPEKVAHISEECNNKLKRSQLADGDILFSIAGAIGRVAIVTKEMLPANTNQALSIIRINRDDVHLPFIKLILTSPIIIKQFERKKQGVAQLNLSLKDIGNLEIPLLTKSEQIEFTEKFDTLQSIITHRKQQLEKLDLLVKARFVEMFGDVIINDKMWSCQPWNNVLTIINGRNQKNVENENGRYLIYGSGGAMGRATNYLTNENSVIIGRKGNINKPILMREKYWNVDTAFGLEPDAKQVLVDYLYMFCVLFDFEKLNKAVTIPSLTKADLLKIEMPIPPLSLQNQFAAFVAQVDKSKFAVQKALDEAQLLFDSLMQEYFG